MDWPQSIDKVILDLWFRDGHMGPEYRLGLYSWYWLRRVWLKFDGSPLDRR